MASPLDQQTFDQSGALVPIKMMTGDSLPSFTASIGLVITGYAFDGAVFDSLDNKIVDFTVNVLQSTPTGVVKYSLTKEQCALITDGASYRVRWTNGADVRTYVYGGFEVIPV